MLDFGQFDFGQFDFGQLAEIELAEVEIGRSRNWPKSKLFGAPLFLGLGLHPLVPHPLWSKNSTSQIGRSRNWPKSKLAKIKIGRSRNWPKSKLAEVELAELEKKLAEVEIGRSRPRSEISRPRYLKLPECHVHWTHCPRSHFFNFQRPISSQQHAVNMRHRHCSQLTIATQREKVIYKPRPCFLTASQTCLASSTNPYIALFALNSCPVGLRQAFSVLFQ